MKKKFGVSTQHYSFAVKTFVEMVKNFNTAEYEFAFIFAAFCFEGDRWDDPTC